MVIPLLGITQDTSLKDLFESAKRSFESNRIEEALSTSVQGLRQAEIEGNLSYGTLFKYLIGNIHMVNGDFDQSIDFFVQLAMEAEGRNDNTGMANAFFSLGNNYTTMGATNNAVNSLTKSYTYYEKAQDKVGQANVARLIGDVNFEAGHYRQSAEAYDLLVGLTDLRGRNSTLLTLGYKGLLNSHDKLNNLKDGIEVALRFEELWNGNPNEQSFAWDLLCRFYRRSNNLDESIEYGRRTLMVDDQNTRFLQNLGESFLDGGNYGEASDLFEKSLAIAQNEDDALQASRAYYLLSKTSFRQGSAEAALTQLGLAEQLSQSGEYSEVLVLIYQLYAEIYRSGSNRDQVANYERQLADVNSKIASDRKTELDKIARIDNRASDIEQRARLEYAEIIKQRLLTTTEAQKEALEQQNRQLQDQQREVEELEGETLNQSLLIMQQQLEAKQKESEILSLQQETKDLELTAMERQRQLEKAEQERIFLEQQSIIQSQRIEAAEERRKLYITIIVISAISLILVIFFLIRLVKSNKLIRKQNLDLEKSEKDLKAAFKLEQSIRKKLQQTQAQLVHAEKMSGLGQLTAGIAHEINNPINFIKGGMQTLNVELNDIYAIVEGYTRLVNLDKENAKDELEKHYQTSSENLKEIKEVIGLLMKDVEFGADRVAEIVEGLKTFSRHDQADFKSSNLHENLDSALLILKNKCRDRAEIIKEYDPKVVEIDCYPGQLNQVFVNVIGNAVDALDNEGQITVKTKEDGDEVEIVIKDTGRGIPQDQLSRIFEPFYTTKDVGEGTGLGLSISYSIIKRHNGKINVKSKVGSGTEFIIRIPKQLQQETPQSSKNEFAEA